LRLIIGDPFRDAALDDEKFDRRGENGPPMQRFERKALILARPYCGARLHLYADILLVAESGERLAQIIGGRREGLLGERAGKLQNVVARERRSRGGWSWRGILRRGYGGGDTGGQRAQRGSQNISTFDHKLYKPEGGAAGHFKLIQSIQEPSGFETAFLIGPR